ncbi:MAG: hypothetical protein GX631_05565 [Dehalococcoidales bacterium]|nr:hypothetical protein [Dehalococcoidales bacterium]
MSEPRYAQYVRQKATRTSLNIPERIHYPFVHMEQDMWGDLGVNANFACSCVQEPFVMPDLPHAHPYDELLYFFGSDPDHPEKLNAVVEFGIGEEWKKLTFDTTAVLRFPANLRHAPVYVRKVDRPFFFGHIMQSSSYAKVDDNAPERVRADDVSYSDIVKIPEFKNTGYGAVTLFNGKAQGVVDTMINLHFITRTASIDRPPEAKGYNQFSILMGGNPMNIPGFTAEAEITLGQEAEKQVVDSTTVIHIPADLPAKPVSFTKVTAPVCMMSYFVPAENR